MRKPLIFILTIPLAIAAAPAGDQIEMQPGLWEMRVEVIGISMPGLDDETKALMMEELAEEAKAESICITAEDLADSEDFLGDLDCEFSQLSVVGGVIEIAGICDIDGDPTDMRMTGTYSSDRYELAGAVTQEDNEFGLTHMRMRLAGRRIAESCPPDGESGADG